VLEGDEFVVNGQKIWTSNAHLADWMFLLARTDPSAPKHRGISYLLLDMKTPGITVRPLVQITGEAHFNETFFDNVRIPRQNLVGELNRGWYVGVATLAHERGVSANTMPVRQMHAAVLSLAKRTRRNGGTAWEDPKVRRELVTQKIRIEGMETLAETVHAVQAAGGSPGSEANMCKWLNATIQQDLVRLALEFLGPYGVLERGSPRARDDGHWPFAYLNARARSIAGGTNEIQLNIIAERGLGLPR
jgi:alkylation response protein AidB-like acyl-CoA dehydrogenase